MKTVRLRVHEGRFVGEAPASLREGSIVHAVIADDDAEIPANELAALEAALDESWAQLEAGEEVSAEDAIRAVSSIG